MKQILLFFISSLLIFDSLFAQYQLNEGIDLNSCSCQYLDESKDFKGFMQTVKSAVRYDEFTEFTEFDLLGGKETYDFIFMAKYTTSGSRKINGYFFEAWSLDPLILTGPNDNFAINLTPCKKESYIHRVPLEITYENKLKYTKFNYKKFKPSTETYLGILMEIASKDEAELLGVLLNTKALIVKDTLVDAWEWINKINRKYKTTIELDSFNLDWSWNGRVYADNLKKHKVDALDFILNEFLLDEKGVRNRDSVGNERLSCLFSRWMGNTTIKTLNRYYIPPQVKANIAVRTIGLQFSDKMVRIINLKKNPAEADSVSTSISNTILAETSGLEYSNAEGFWGELYNVCMPVCEIARTGILFNFQEAFLTSSQSKYFKKQILNNYPLLYGDSVRKYRCLHYEHDTLTKAFELKPADLAKDFIHRYVDLKYFEGLMIENADFVIPYKKEKLTGIGTNILLSNHLFTGKIALPIIPTSNKKVVQLMIGESNYKLSLKAFKRYLKGLGFDKVMFEVKESELLFSFKKLN